MEIWKDVVGYEGLYEVSNNGRVRSLPHTSKYKRGDQIITTHKEGAILRPQKRQHGYLGVQLYGKGGNTRGFKTFSVHRIVAEAFIENPNNLPEVNHKDENKQNNSVDNLEWISRVDNIRHGTCIQRMSTHRINNPIRCKRIIQMDMQGNYIKEYPSLAEIHRQTGYSQSNICNFINGKTNNKHQYGYLWKYAE